MSDRRDRFGLKGLLMVAVMLLIAGLPAQAQQSVDDAALARLKANGAAAHSDVLLVLQNGNTLINERGDVNADPVIETMSATKAVVALAVLKAVDDGKIAGLDVPLTTWFPEWRQGRKAAITLRMLLTHTTGLQNVANAGVEVESAPDAIKLALAAELDAAPGEHRAYNNKATNLLAEVVARATGKPLDEYVAQRLFQPMGIETSRWRRDPAGNVYAMAGLQLTANDMAKVGKLVLDRGKWAGKTLVSEEMIDNLLAPAMPGAGDVGLNWVRTPAWVRYSIDAASLERLRKIGLDEDVVARLQPLVGRRFNNRSELSAALKASIGDAISRWAEVMIRTGNTPDTVFPREAGPIAAYSAQGYLGQFIVVVPRDGIVAVRQYRWRKDAPQADSYSGFVEDVLALTRK